MSNWKEYRLGDCIEFIIDNRGKNPPLSNNGYELIETISINSENKYPDYSKISKFVSKDTYNNWFRKGHPKKGDILISTVGANIGRVSIMNENRGCIAQNLIGLRTDKEKLVPDYLYYFLIKKSTQHTLSSLNIGSAQPSIKVPHLLNILINVPNIQRQEEIANILSSLDEKIELNTQINQTLEQIAQALFKSWFVDFDPVRAKAQALSDGMSLEQAELAAMQAISGKKTEELTALSQTQPERYAELAETAKAFPSEIVEVDGVEVPKGWEVKRIDEIANIIKGKSYKSSELEKSKTALVTLKSFNRGGGYRLDGLKEYTGKYKPEQEVFAGELIIAYTDVTQAADVIGKPAMVMSDSNYQHLVISLDVGVVRPFNDVYKHFLYCLAMTESFQAHTKSFCTGTTVLHLGKDAVPSFEFINPSNELLHVFYKQTSPIFEKINLQIEENKNLDKVRDLLLPRLLNGEIK
ncbi:restriction endonuclease subunit S [Haemophilus haemolyticus]|uniref:Restriction endonuclease subunit S n=1 Tax=Haemophilus haemolyticus TaxID=726 RepID=A0A852PKA5_HAEHA|nr:restriction endonuclease subunit S [Haemophilus haemolyticus]NYA26714.1 restriction endonuclease subunit S [Haemophilus haemolyticus]